MGKWRSATRKGDTNGKTRTTRATYRRAGFGAAGFEQCDGSRRLPYRDANRAGRLLPHEPILADATDERRDGPRDGRVRHEPERRRDRGVDPGDRSLAG